MNLSSFARISVVLILYLTALAGEASFAKPAAADANFYVALNGSDSWSGTLPAPNSAHTDGPFATIDRARDAVRTLKMQGAVKEPITVVLRGGKYFLKDTVTFGAEDSGTRDSPITYAAYAGERPILSGGRRLIAWKPFRGKILVADLPEAKGGRWKFRQLFLNRKRQLRSRWPHEDRNDPMYGGWAFMAGPAEKGSTTGFEYRAGTFAHHWAKPREGEVEFYLGQGQWRSTVPIQSVDEDRRTIRLTHPGVQFDVLPWYQLTPFAEGNPFYVANELEDLDQPGEWCFDSDEGKLYFWPPAGKLTDQDEVVVPALRTLVDISGASWLEFTGLTFTETMDGDNFHHEGVQGVGAMYPQANWQFGGDALHLKDAAFCLIDGNRFDAVGCNAIYLEGYNYRNEIRRNEIAYAGANGICLLGTVEKHPLFNRVEDNYIHHVGTLNKYVAGVFLGMSDGNIVGHNRIEYVPHHAINLSNNPYGRNIVEYNILRFTCLEIMDTGAINSWMEQPASMEAARAGHVIRFNYIADAFGFQVAKETLGKIPSEFTDGIYLDNYTSNCFVYGNIIVRCRNGIMIHAGRNNVVENNILVNCWADLWIIDAVSGASPYWKNMAGFMSGNYLWRNIFYQSSSEEVFLFIHNGWTERTFADSNFNLIYHGGDSNFPLEDRRGVQPKDKVPTLADWKMLGYEKDSIMADPHFVDAAHDDYRLKPDSPAFKLGFVPIDVEQIGPRK